MYSYFDTHCDTLLKIYKDGMSFNDTKLMISGKTLNLYKPMVQCFAVFNDGKLSIDDFFDVALLMKKICENEGIVFCRTANDIAKVKQSGGRGAVLTIEGLGNTKNLNETAVSRLRRSGYAMAGLVWNYDNQLCGGCLGKGGGLTADGKSIVRHMHSVGMIADVSHMSDKSFYDVLQFCKPIVASHSNCRTICNNPRNLTDDMLRAIIAGGGVVGVNFYPPFLSVKNADISDVVRHIEHIISLGGEKSVCIGSDFDGIDRSADGLSNAADVSKIFAALEGKNYSKSTINDICFNNVYNIFEKYEISY